MLVGAILAGGESRRMGKPKVGMSLPSGLQMGTHLVQILEGMTDLQVVVGWPQDVPKLHSALTLMDEKPDAGPLSGLTTLLASQLGTRYLILPCDMPLIRPQLLERLLASEEPACVFQSDDQFLHPLPLVLEPSALDVARRCLHSPDRSLRSFLSQIDTKQISITPKQARELRSFNTPDAFQALFDEIRSAAE